MIKLVIFDYGSTLYDHEANAFYPGAREVLEYCKQRGYKSAIVSYVDLSKGSTVELRMAELDKAGLTGFFDSFKWTTGDPTKKNALYEETLRDFGVTPQETVIVDDYIIRGIRWGNQHGCMTIWFKNGKFADRLPNEESGQPTYIISLLKELIEIL